MSGFQSETDGANSSDVNGSSPTQQPANRRVFLQQTIAATAGTMLWNVSKSASARPSRNQVLRVGVVGIHGRGQDHLNNFEKSEYSEVVAVCDCDQNVLNRVADEHDQKTNRKVKRFTDIRKLLDDRDIDIVTIATPNHWHALMGIWAMQAGKDVYVEKPCSHNLLEGQRLVAAADFYKRICQHGTQRRSYSGLREAVQFLRDGGLGPVYMARALCYKWRPSIGQHKLGTPPAHLDWNLWQGPAREQEYSSLYVHYNWHWFWDYGNGDIGNQGVHQMDVALWGLGKDTGPLPSTISSRGGRFGYQDDGQTPNTETAVFQWDDCQLVFEVRGLPTNQEEGVSIGNLFYGPEGVLVIGEGSEWFTLMGKKREPGVKGKGGGDHYRNFLEAVVQQDASKLHAPIHCGQSSAALCHFANVAYRRGQVLSFDLAENKFRNDADANALAYPEYRTPFALPQFG